MGYTIDVQIACKGKLHSSTFWVEQTRNIIKTFNNVDFLKIGISEIISIGQTQLRKLKQ